MRPLYRTSIVIGAVVAATAITATAAALAASGTGSSTADEQPALVEDYTYPGADQVLATYHVQLISGDGHIVITDCPPNVAGVIAVQSSNRVGRQNDGLVCFRVTGATGHLTMKIPEVYSIRGDGVTQTPGHKLKAELTTDAGQHSTVDVNPNGTTQVGIGTNPPGAATTLLQLDTSS
ncbi:hypothetical protein [Amycolatopsis dendrobii]|uniref:Secreted protein n=1 Tax=Amycolatopsis dendrobii TaxID=2760662 RepID=A0A7W3ZEK5_9PSEU|nr:hypothetical protein [Amycolatopsis dendrobii]MBB1158143.1 hypothetical protein [Amycolatopsis dendrobii]